MFEFRGFLRHRYGHGIVVELGSFGLISGWADRSVPLDLAMSACWSFGMSICLFYSLARSLS
jgi:hypothetical protein